MKAIRIFLLILIILGLGLIVAQGFWVPPLVREILLYQSSPLPIESTTPPEFQISKNTSPPIADTIISTTTTAFTMPSDFNFDYSYAWAGEINTFTGTFTKFEGEGVPSKTVAFHLSQTDMQRVYDAINQAELLTNPSATKPPSTEGPAVAMTNPCGSYNLKVVANGITHTLNWSCTVYPNLHAVINFMDFMSSLLQSEYNSLPPPTGGLPQ
jgi:hypothetical protein